MSEDFSMAAAAAESALIGISSSKLALICEASTSGFVANAFAAVVAVLAVGTALREME